MTPRGRPRKPNRRHVPSDLYLGCWSMRSSSHCLCIGERDDCRRTHIAHQTCPTFLYTQHSWELLAALLASILVPGGQKTMEKNADDNPVLLVQGKKRRRKQGYECRRMKCRLG